MTAQEEAPSSGYRRVFGIQVSESGFRNPGSGALDLGSMFFGQSWLMTAQEEPPPSGYGPAGQEGVRNSHCGIPDPGSRFRDSGFGIRDSGFGFQVPGFGFWDSGFGTRDSGFGIREEPKSSRALSSANPLPRTT